VALLGAGGFLTTLIGSAVAPVPLQRRILAASPQHPDAIDQMWMRWFGGHLFRSALSAVSFIAVAVAATF